jgi:hypothetical protein
MSSRSTATVNCVIDRNKLNNDPSDVFGNAAYDFIAECWLSETKPHIPRAEDFAELFRPYIEYIRAEAKAAMIQTTLSEHAQRLGRTLFLHDYLKDLNSEKEKALTNIHEEQIKRRFGRTQFPERSSE